jgi:hypothetical protein
MSNQKRRKTSTDIGDLTIPAKLVWTTRLFDTLTARKWWIGDSSREIEGMLEAEIVPSCQEGVFPSRFDWDKLTALLDLESGGVTFCNTRNDCGGAFRKRLARISDCLRDPTRAGSGQEVSGKQNVRILWLSPTVFISSCAFEIFGHNVGWINFCDFCFELTVRRKKKELRFHAFSLSTFEDEQFPPRRRVASPLVPHFFQHLCGALPSDYFSEIKFRKSHSHFPAEYFIPLFAVLSAQPKGTLASRPWTRIFDYSDFKKYEQITREDLEILSQVFHSKVDLTFKGFDHSVTISDLSNFLQGPSPPGSVSVQSRHFAANKVPWKPVEEAFPVSEISFESPTLKLSLHMRTTRISHAILCARY